MPCVSLVSCTKCRKYSEPFGGTFFTHASSEGSVDGVLDISGFDKDFDRFEEGVELRTLDDLLVEGFRSPCCLSIFSISKASGVSNSSSSYGTGSGVVTWSSTIELIRPVILHRRCSKV